MDGDEYEIRVPKCQFSSVGVVIEDLTIHYLAIIPNI
jgi:hypothetical protein